MPATVNTGVPLSGVQVLSIERIFSPAPGAGPLSSFQTPPKNASGRPKASGRRKAIRRAASAPEYALLLHLDGGDVVKDTSVYAFELKPENVSYAAASLLRTAWCSDAIVVGFHMCAAPSVRYW